MTALITGATQITSGAIDGPHLLTLSGLPALVFGPAPVVDRDHAKAFATVDSLRSLKLGLGERSSNRPETFGTN